MSVKLQQVKGLSDCGRHSPPHARSNMGLAAASAQPFQLSSSGEACHTRDL